MGLFSKKDYVCVKCGKKFQARLSPIDGLCDDCYNARESEKYTLIFQITGYDMYREDYKAGSQDFTPEEIKAIISHRSEILEKYRMKDGISKEELRWASDNFKSLSEDEAIQIMMRVNNSMVTNTAGAAYTDNFFVLTNYERTIVDVKDIFAVCYCSDYNIKLVSNDEVILCGVFTNDPYIPAFPVVYSGKKGIFELTKSKGARQQIQEHFTTMCPNLTYPVCDVKEFKKMIKNETTIKGNIDKKELLEKIFEVSVSSGVFNTKDIRCDVLNSTSEMLEKAGYITVNEMNQILNMDCKVNRQFWNKVIELMAARC